MHVYYYLLTSPALTRLAALLADVDDVERGTPSQIDSGTRSSSSSSSSNNSRHNSNSTTSSGHDSSDSRGSGTGGLGHGIDLVIVDYDITDCFSLLNHHDDDDDINDGGDNDAGGGGGGDRHRSNGTFINQSYPYLSHLHQSNPHQSNLESATELLVRRILDHQSHPALVFTNVAVPNTGQPLLSNAS